CERGVIARVGGRWSLCGEVPDLRRELPESVRAMIERKLERLDATDHQLVAAASVQGHEFDSAVVAEVVAMDAGAVEDRLRARDRVHGLVRRVRESEFADRTPTVRYAFVHILYQQTLADELPTTRRVGLAAALGRSLEAHHGANASTIAAAL